MYNLLQAECYKLKRSRSFLVCGIAVAAVVFFLFGTLALMQAAVQQGENGTPGVVVVTESMEAGAEGETAAFFGEIGLLDVLQQLFSGDFVAIILAIFIGIFVTGEYGSGSIKNIVGKGYSRGIVYLSRFLAAAAAGVVFLFIGAVMNLFCGLLFMGKGAFAGGIWRDLAIYMGLQAVMNISLTAVFMLVGEIIRNLAGSLSIGIAIAIISNLLLRGLDLLFMHMGVRPSGYWLMNMSMDCPVAGFEAGYVAKTLLVAMLWLAAALGAGIWHFNKADIR